MMYPSYNDRFACLCLSQLILVCSLVSCKSVSVLVRGRGGVWGAGDGLKLFHLTLQLLNYSVFIHCHLALRKGMNLWTMLPDSSFRNHTTSLDNVEN